MSYATPEQYNEYGNGLIPADDLEKALSRASDQIDRLTYNRIVARGFDNLTDFQKLNVTKAVCEQADYTYQFGDYLALPMAGFGAGSISMSFGKGKDGSEGIKKSPDEVMDLLMPTGLTDRRL